MSTPWELLPGLLVRNTVGLCVAWDVSAACVAGLDQALRYEALRGLWQRHIQTRATADSVDANTEEQIREFN